VKGARNKPESKRDTAARARCELERKLDIQPRNSRRKLKQVYHLFQFIEKLLRELPGEGAGATLADQVETLRKSWDKYDFFFLHYKYTDSTGEDGNFPGKVEMIERLDAEVRARPVVPRPHGRAGVVLEALLDPAPHLRGDRDLDLRPGRPPGPDQPLASALPLPRRRLHLLAHFLEESLQHIAGANLHHLLRAIGEHVLHGLRPTHGRGELCDQVRLDACGFGMRAGVHVRPHRHIWGGNRDTRQGRGEFPVGRSHDVGVERPRDRQTNRLRAGLGGEFLDLVARRFGAGDDRVARTEQVGDLQRAGTACFGAQLFDLIDRQRQHADHLLDGQEPGQLGGH